MSSKTTVEVTCPACGAKHKVSIWKSINTTLDPEMKQAVRDRSAFLFTCPSCGYQTHLSYGFLYHQMEDGILIHLANSEKNAEEIYKMIKDKDAVGFFSFADQDYLIRIVMSDKQFREKLFIFDAGLDDRIIELYKIFVLAMFQKESEEVFDKIGLYFYTDNDGKHYIQIIADNKTKGVVEMENDIYENLCRDYMPRLKDIRKDEPFIDRQWALEMMDSFAKKQKEEDESCPK